MPKRKVHTRNRVQPSAALTRRPRRPRQIRTAKPKGISNHRAGTAPVRSTAPGDGGFHPLKLKLPQHRPGAAIFPHIVPQLEVASPKGLLQAVKDICSSMADQPGWNPPLVSADAAIPNVVHAFFTYLSHYIKESPVLAGYNIEVVTDKEGAFGRVLLNIWYGPDKTGGLSLPVFYLPYLDKNSRTVYSLFIGMLHFIDQTGIIGLSEFTAWEYNCMLEDSYHPTQYMADYDEDNEERIKYLEEWNDTKNRYKRSGDVGIYQQEVLHYKNSLQEWCEHVKQWKPGTTFERDMKKLLDMGVYIASQSDNIRNYGQRHDSEEYNDWVGVTADQQWAVVWAQQNELMSRIMDEHLESWSNEGTEECLGTQTVYNGKKLKVPIFHLPTELNKFMRYGTKFADKYFTYKGKGVFRIKNNVRFTQPSNRLIDILK